MPAKDGEADDELDVDGLIELLAVEAVDAVEETVVEEVTIEDAVAENVPTTEFEGVFVVAIAAVEIPMFANVLLT